MTRFAPARPDPSLPKLAANLYSDTQTKPSLAMRQTMLTAEVGDEQNGDDATVNALCARVAALLGKEDAVFLPSGTMCNEIAILVHCRPGDEVLAHETAHIITAEGGAPGALAGVRVLPLPGPRGLFDADAVRAAVFPRGRYSAPQTLLSVEQTSNLGGGAVWPLAALREVAAAARGAGMATHMDGARLMNAVVAGGVAAADMAADYDSVWLDFTKGLGAPIGAVLAGSAAFIDQAWRWKQRLGGAMRQVGIAAACCLYALDHNVERLAEDHANALRLAQRVAQLPGVAVEMPETNLVYIDPTNAGLTAPEFAARLRQRGISVSVMGPRQARAALHLDVDVAQVDLAAQVMAEVLSAV
jgi:threonine aldolase